MIEVARRSWAAGRRWTPGEIAWAARTGDGSDQVAFMGDGFCWQQPDYAVIVATNAEEANEGLIWAADDRAVQVSDRDEALAALMRSSGYRELVDAPFDLDLRLATSAVGDYAALSGFVVRPAQPSDDLVAVHRAAWHPPDLPFAEGHRPPFAPDAASTFSAQQLAAVEAADDYDRRLHLVAEADDGALAGACIGWLDPANGTVAIEPLGVVPANRRRGIAGALCLEVARLGGQRGAREVIIHPRGDSAYPAPRAAYHAVGFEAVGRTRLLAKT